MTEVELISRLQEQAIIARTAILAMTTLAGSGHPGGSMSSIDLLLTLYQFIRHNPQNPELPDRDRVVVSNGHISPAVYTALALNGYHNLDEVISQFRLSGSIYEGHIERDVKGVEWSTGNLGQGLSAGAGFALASRINNIPYNVYVLMGDGEQQKGQISEARRFAIKYQLNNLTAIVDYNELQISGNIHSVMPQNIKANWESDGWKVIEIDGHNYQEILSTLQMTRDKDYPLMILAHTVMGKGVPFMENQAKYHGAALNEAQLEEALHYLGQSNRLEDYKMMRAEFKPVKQKPTKDKYALQCNLKSGNPMLYEKPTDNRSAWGNAIADLAEINKNNPTPIVVTDCDLQSSVKTAAFEKVTPDRFFQGGIMEHNTAVLSGALSTCGIQSFWSDFGVFGLDEVYNQQRLNDINHTNLKVVLTHTGLDVGEDGKTHQCIDYIGIVRNWYGFHLIIPADPNQTDRIIRWLIDKPGNYVVTMGRSAVPIILKDDGKPFYDLNYAFDYGKCDILRKGDKATVMVTGTPIGNALKAVDTLKEEGINLQLIYVSCPLAINRDTLIQAANTGLIFSIEDHNIHSGLGSIIADRLAEENLSTRLIKIGVKNYGSSGTSNDLYKAVGLDAESIKERIKQELINKD
ncbi:MAG TPA: transketolase [Candidatus Syntrophosphaera thermopropionivorans]|nr:transketolase [Candidatus Syntrophosphaera thermopropionivorans]